MKLIDWVLLALIGLAVAIALRSVLKHSGGGCSGNCSVCSGCASKGKCVSRREAVSGAKAQAERTISPPDMKPGEQQKGKRT